MIVSAKPYLGLALMILMGTAPTAAQQLTRESALAILKKGGEQPIYSYDTVDLGLHHRFYRLSSADIDRPRLIEFRKKVWSQPVAVHADLLRRVMLDFDVLWSERGCMSGPSVAEGRESSFVDVTFSWVDSCGAGGGVSSSQGVVRLAKWKTSLSAVIGVSQEGRQADVELKFVSERPAMTKGVKVELARIIASRVSGGVPAFCSSARTLLEMNFCEWLQESDAPREETRMVVMKRFDDGWRVAE